MNDQTFYIIELDEVLQPMHYATLCWSMTFGSATRNDDCSINIFCIFAAHNTNTYGLNNDKILIAGGEQRPDRRPAEEPALHSGHPLRAA